MLHTMWSVKGGSGVTLVSARLAASFARRTGRAVVVDLRGDQPALFGRSEPATPGVCDWLASPEGSDAALARLLIEADDGVWLLPRGDAVDWPQERVADLAVALDGLGGEVVIDCGVLAGPHVAQDAVVRTGRQLAVSGRSLLVTRLCYLALRRAAASDLVADGVIVVAEAGRALDGHDVSAVLGLPVLATVDVDPTVARAVDAGILMRSTRRNLDRSLRGAA